jgi:arginase
LAVKIVRQPKKIALIGAPTSAGAHTLGPEKAPAALRAAGLVERLSAAGYEVTDLGDIDAQLFQADDESPRARNIRPVLAALAALRTRVEMATKSGALPFILGGDCTIAIATTAGVRRYFRNVAMVYVDRDADLNVPATTPSGRLDGMVVAHMIGRGAPELVRFWGEPPLVREPDIALFGLDRLDPPEREFLEDSPMLRYTAGDIAARGAGRLAAQLAERMHGSSREFVLHFDVDVIASEDFSASDWSAPGGMRLGEVREALGIFASQKHLAAFEVTEFNPDRDPDGSAARALVEMIAGVLAQRLEVLAAAEQEPPPEAAERPEAKVELEAPPVEAKPASPPPPPVVTSPADLSAAAAASRSAASKSGERPTAPAGIFYRPPAHSAAPAPGAAEDLSEKPAEEPAEEGAEAASEEFAEAGTGEVAEEPAAVSDPEADAGEPRPEE